METDPFEMHDLADEPKLADIKARLRKELDAWMRQQGDKGMETEMLATSRRRKE